MNILIIHYNTPKLTTALIASIRKTTPLAKIYVFDNSNVLPLTEREGIEYLDNTHGQYINWGLWLESFPDKYPKVQNNYGSAKHTKSVDVCFNLIPDGFILLDSDVLVKKDLTALWHPDYAWTGEVNKYEGHKINIARVLPYVCHINVPVCRAMGITYYNPEYTWKLTSKSPNRYYDTGAWLFHQSISRCVPYRKIRYADYVVHYGCGSWKIKDDESKWLKEHEELWKK